MGMEVERWMRAEAERGDERAFEMHPENRGVVGGGISGVALGIFRRVSDRLVDVRDFFDWRGDCGGQPCGGAFARGMAGGGAERDARRGDRDGYVRTGSLE